MRKILLAFISIVTTAPLLAQMDIPPSGSNPRAMISEEVGITSITIKYSRPDVNKREGKIYGDGNPVTYGFSSTNFITNKPTSPWRAGANEATVITFEHDVKVEGKDIKAGSYALFMAMGLDNVTLIFSRQSEAWGSFYYKEEDDVLRVDVKPVILDKSVEWLKYEFIEHREKHCIVAMQWEKFSVPFKIDVDVDKIVLARLREQTISQKNFNSTNMIQASSWCFNKNINIEEALGWAQRAVSGFQGQKSYVSLRNLATGYEKLNRLQQADSVMAEALTMANVNQYSTYARALIAQKRNDKALEIMNTANAKFGDVFAVNNTMMFIYSSKEDYANAIKYAKKALAQAANDAAKKMLESQITKLKEGKDINQQ